MCWLTDRERSRISFRNKVKSMVVKTQFDTEPPRIFPNDDGIAVLTCPNCDRRKTVDLAAFLQAHRTLKVQCGCGRIFPILVDIRRFYRKNTHLAGRFQKFGAKESGSIEVTNISFRGIQFRTIFSHQLCLGDVLEISFTLDTTERTELVRKVRVRHVQKRSIGTEFCDEHAYDTVLAYYLNPS